MLFNSLEFLIFLAYPSQFKLHIEYFQYLNKEPDFKSIEDLEELRKNLGIKVIYVIPPKSKIYLHNLIVAGNDKIWEKILTTLKSKNIDIWNYEAMHIDTLISDWFFDETHMVYDGAKAFTKIIRNRLKEN